MIVSIDHDLSTPAFEQLRSQITRLVRSGAVEPGARLPTVRQLAKDLELAPGTVQRAYRELENDGLVEGRGRRGTFVRSQVEEVPPDVLDDALAAAATRFALAAQQLGADRQDALAAISEALEQAPATASRAVDLAGQASPRPTTASLAVVSIDA